MESMDHVRERIEALEQQMRAMGAHTRTVERRLRWWRGLAYGVMVLGLLSGALLSGKTVDAQQGGLPERVTALENKLVAVTFNSATKELVITGANLHIVNGLRRTDTTNGQGNLIVGYNEPRGFQPDVRTGSHNVVVGSQHNFSSFGGLVVGIQNEISGQYASVSGGLVNTASGPYASVSGGFSGTANNDFSSVTAGLSNTASGVYASVSGGENNIANGAGASVSGGDNNRAAGPGAAVSGGRFNTASGQFASISGGDNNGASGDFSSVSGGTNRNAPGAEDWVAGPLFTDN
jgi:hypothetical protein